MKSENVISFADFANQYNGFISEYGYSLFPDPSEFMEYLSDGNGKIIVIGSRPGQGKTSLMLSLIKDTPHIPVLIFSLELSAFQLINRFMCIAGEIKLSPSLVQIKEHELLTDNNLMNTNRHVFICDIRKITFEKFHSIITFQQSENPVKLVFIDYYQLLDEATPELLFKIKKCAELFNLTIVVLSQLERNIDTNPMKTPTIASFPRLNEIDNIDEAYYLFRPDRYGIIRVDNGYCLENTGIVNCLKGKFKNNKILFKINNENSAFVKADAMDVLMKME